MQLQLSLTNVSDAPACLDVATARLVVTNTKVRMCVFCVFICVCVCVRVCVCAHVCTCVFVSACVCYCLRKVIRVVYNCVVAFCAANGHRSCCVPLKNSSVRVCVGALLKALTSPMHIMQCSCCAHRPVL